MTSHGGNLLSLYLLRINESNLFCRKNVLTSNICLAWKHIWKTTALYRKERCIWGYEENRHEFDDWLVTIPFAVGVGKETLDVDILCCPEDKRCTNSKCMQNQRRVCEQCEVPLCSECAGVVDEPWDIFDGYLPKPPRRALSSDLMIFYAPKSLYEDQMTVLEMICSSVCITSMICFSMEVKYGHLLDTRVHMQDTRVAARGNATSFLMPWQSILAELRRLEKKEKRSEEVDLPLSGEDLRSVVQVLLKCNDSAQKKNLPKFIHQATVRRAIVVRHIEDMKRRGHKAYQHVNMDKVREKAKAELPENGVPDILLKDLPFEANIQKMLIQKHATTVPEPTRDLKKVEHLLSVTVPNAVTMERSSCDMVDYNSMHHNVFENVKARARSAEVAATEKPGSFFAALQQEQRKTLSKHRKLGKEAINIRQYFTETAIRDNIMAYAMMQYLSDDDLDANLRCVVCTSKSSFDCNVSEEEA